VTDSTHPNNRPGDQPAVTLRTLQKMARDAEPFASLTCYDATTARWLERAGVHVLLVEIGRAHV